MDDLSRKFRSIDWKGLQKSARKVQASTASALKDLVMTDLENKVRAATADTSWGASGTDLMQISQATYNREDYALIMSIVWQRLSSSRWRCVYKGLDVLRHLIMHGAARCADEARAAVTHIHALENFRYIDPKTMKDDGANVRAKAQLVVAILNDSDLLEEEREKSKALRAKLAGGTSMSLSGRPGGMSSEDYRYGQASGRDDFGEPSVTTSTAGKYAGYDDDDELDAGASGYDDAATGSFAKKFANGGVNGAGAEPSHLQNVDDLLGGDDAPSTAWDDPVADAMAVTNGVEGSGMSGGTHDAPDDLFGALALTEATPAADAGSSTLNTKDMPTSLLIQNLVAAQSQNFNYPPANQPSQPTGTTNGTTKSMSPETRSAEIPNGSFPQTNISLSAAQSVTDSTPSPIQVAPPVQAPVPLTRKADADPFGDLLATAKQSGVL